MTNSYCLGELIDIIHGYAFDGEHITNIITDPILVTPGNFNIGGGFKSDNNKHYNGALPKEYVFDKGDLIVTMTDLSVTGDTLGYSALVPGDNIYLHNQRVGKVIIKNDLIDKLFLYYVMRTKEYHNFVYSTSTGTAIHHTSPSLIKKFQIQLPDIENQKKIGLFLYSLEKKIEINQKINANLGGVSFAS